MLANDKPELAAAETLPYPTAIVPQLYECHNNNMLVPRHIYYNNDFWLNIVVSHSNSSKQTKY